MAQVKKQEKPIKQRLEEALVLYEKTPYKLPLNWCWVKLPLMYQNVTSSDKKIPQKSYLEEGQYSIVDQGKDLVGGYTNDNKYLYEGTLPVVIFGDHTRAVKYIDFEFAQGADGVKVLKPAQGIYPKYLYYCIKNLNITDLGYRRHFPLFPQYCAPLAPFEEQKRIVEIIEKQFAKLDEARDLIQKCLDSFADRKSAILHKAFTGELTQKWRELYERNTYNWTRKAIGDLFFHTTGKALKKGNTDGILCKYITTSNLYWGRFDFSEVREMYFTEKELEKCTVRKGDLLICNGGDVGRAAIWPYDHKICLQNHISKLRPKEQNLDIRFFFYYFMYLKVKGDIKGKGIGIASLSAKDLLSMQVMLPLLDEQEEIVLILDSIFEKEDKSKELIDMLDKIDEMKKSILARAFRGQLGTSNPNDEPATDLLRKILGEKEE